MKLKYFFTSTFVFVLAVLGISDLADSHETRTDDSTTKDTLQAASINTDQQCDSPYNLDYMDVLEGGSDEVKFAGCGGLL